MLMTEDQAREKWCPMVRAARHEVTQKRTAVTETLSAVREDHHVVGGCNTDTLGGTRVPESCRCVASDCAMWRWGEWKRDGVENVPLPSGHTYTRDRKIPLRGYCGLAGRPEVA